MYACFKGLPKPVLREALAFWEGCTEPPKPYERCAAHTFRGKSCCPWGAFLWAVLNDDWTLLPGSGGTVVRLLLQHGQLDLAEMLRHPKRIAEIDRFMREFDNGNVKNVRRAMGLN